MAALRLIPLRRWAAIPALCATFWPGAAPANDGLAQRVLEIGEARWRALNLEGLGDGLAETAIQVQRERGRPDARYWDAWEVRNATKFGRTMGWLEANADLLDGPVTIGQIAVACALGWTEFRLPELLEGTDTRWPRLFRWYRTFCERPSMKATVPR